MGSKEDKERAGRDYLTRKIYEDNNKRGRLITEREVDSIVSRVQEKTDKEGKIK